jgi:hypothetical protein
LERFFYERLGEFGVRLGREASLNATSEFYISKLTDVYTKMVVIVNANRTVDKQDFFHNIKRLRAIKLDGKTLYPDCTEVGQKMSCLQEAAFCTSHPVDTQPVFHR